MMYFLLGITCRKFQLKICISWLTESGLCKHQPCGFIPAPKGIHEYLSLFTYLCPEHGLEKLFVLLY